MGRPAASTTNCMRMAALWTAILNEAQYFLKAMPRNRGFPAYRIAFGSNSADLRRRITTRTWTSRRRPRFRASLRISGKCASWRKEPRYEGWPIADCDVSWIAARPPGARTLRLAIATFYEQINCESALEWWASAITSDIDETGEAAKSHCQTFKIACRGVRKRIIASPDFPVGTRDAEDLLRDGRCPGERVDLGLLPEPCEVPSDTPAGTPAGVPFSAEHCPPRRASSFSEPSCMTPDLKTTGPLPVVNPPNKPNPAPQFCDSMSHKEIRALCTQTWVSAS